MLKQNKGFTLIELLIIIGIIGFLAAAILVAVDPVRRIQEARDSKRWAEVNALLNAILTKQVDERSYFEGGDELVPIIPDDGPQVIVSESDGVSCALDSSDTPRCDAVVGFSSTGKRCIADLSALAPTYIAAIPVDPHGTGWDPDPANGTESLLGPKNTGYYIIKDSSDVGSPGNMSATYTYTIGACWPEQTGDIKVKR